MCESFNVTNKMFYLVIFIITLLVTSATAQVIEFDSSLNDTIYINVSIYVCNLTCLYTYICIKLLRYYYGILCEVLTTLEKLQIKIANYTKYLQSYNAKFKE